MQGRPILFYKLGATNLDAMYKLATMEQIKLYHIQVRATQCFLFGKIEVVNARASPHNQ